MSSFFYGVAVGIVFLLILTGVILPETIQTHRQQGIAINNAIEECEESLPRDQYCDWRVETFVKDKEVY